MWHEDIFLFAGKFKNFFFMSFISACEPRPFRTKCVVNVPKSHERSIQHRYFFSLSGMVCIRVDSRGPERGKNHVKTRPEPEDSGYSRVGSDFSKFGFFFLTEVTVVSAGSDRGSYANTHLLETRVIYYILTY